MKKSIFIGSDLMASKPFRVALCDIDGKQLSDQLTEVTAGARLFYFGRVGNVALLWTGPVSFAGKLWRRVWGVDIEILEKSCISEHEFRMGFDL
jgi:hypothetical protein